LDFLLIWLRDPNKVAGKKHNRRRKKKTHRLISSRMTASHPSLGIIPHAPNRRTQQRQQQDEKIVTQVESPRYGRQNAKKATPSDALIIFEY
jgi:hypothetical protein